MICVWRSNRISKKFWHGGDTTLQPSWQEEQGHDHQGQNGKNFPDHDAQPIVEGGTIQSDKLLGGQIREKQRPRNEGKGQCSSGEKEALGTFKVVSTRDPVGQHSDKASEKQKGNDGQGLHGESAHSVQGKKKMPQERWPIKLQEPHRAVDTFLGLI